MRQKSIFQNLKLFLWDTLHENVLSVFKQKPSHCILGVGVGGTTVDVCVCVCAERCVCVCGCGSAEWMKSKPVRHYEWVTSRWAALLISLFFTSQFQEEEKKKHLSAQSGSVFHSMLFDFSLGKEKLNPPPQHDIDESFVFETVVNKLWLSRLLESFPQKTPREHNRRPRLLL